MSLCCGGIWSTSAPSTSTYIIPVPSVLLPLSLRACPLPCSLSSPAPSAPGPSRSYLLVQRYGRDGANYCFVLELCGASLLSQHVHIHISWALHYPYRYVYMFHIIPVKYIGSFFMFLYSRIMKSIYYLLQENKNKQKSNSRRVIFLEIFLQFILLLLHIGCLWFLKWCEEIIMRTPDSPETRQTVERK